MLKNWCSLTTGPGDDDVQYVDWRRFGGEWAAMARYVVSDAARVSDDGCLMRRNCGGRATKRGKARGQFDLSN